MELFAREFRERLEACLSHGQRERVATAAGVTRDEVSRWGKWRGKHWQIPSIYEISRAAEALNVSPAYLAFQQGPKDEHTAKMGFEVAEQAAGIACFEEVVRTCIAMDQSEREHLLWFVSKMKRPGAQQVIESIANNGLNSAPDLAMHSIEKRPLFTNMRKNIPTFSTAVASHGRAAIPQWMNLAAGPGRPLERCKEDICFIESSIGNVARRNSPTTGSFSSLHPFRNTGLNKGLPRSAHFHAALIKGDSMLETLHDGDCVILDSFGEQGEKLTPLSCEDAKNPIDRLRAKVPDDSICVLSVNDHNDLTVKRVRYARQSGSNWHLLMLADNPHEKGYPRIISRSDDVIFWARVVGIAGAGSANASS